MSHILFLVLDGQKCSVTRRALWESANTSVSRLLFAPADQILFTHTCREGLRQGTHLHWVCICTCVYYTENCIYDSKASLMSLVSLCCCICDDWTTMKAICRSCRKEVMNMKKYEEWGRREEKGGREDWSAGLECNTVFVETLHIFHLQILDLFILALVQHAVCFHYL